MKIKETAKGNVQITMSKEQAASLSEMLNKMTMHDYTRFSRNSEHIRLLWDLLARHKHIL